MRPSFQNSARLLLSALLLSGLTLASAQSDKKPVKQVDRVIAVVNTEVITARELDEAVSIVTSRVNSKLPPADILRDRVLEQIVIERAQLQAARERGIDINDTEIDRAIDRITEKNNLTLTQLRARLNEDGTSFAKFREDVRIQITEARLREAVVQSQVRVSDADIDAWLAEQEGKKKNSIEFLVAQIMLRLPESASAAEATEKRALLDDIAKQLEQGADFTAVAKRYSEASRVAENGGVLGWRSLEELPRIFADPISSLEPGQLSGVVRSPAGLHLLKLVDRRGGGAAGKPVQQTKVRHILIRPSPALTEDEIRRRLFSIRERLAAGKVTFEEMARQYSVDGSAGNGGDLGWVYAGDTVPEFERAMAELRPGEISEPIRTQFGFHLIEVLDRREDSASPERRRQAARRELLDARGDAAWNEWLDELRARTYVEKRFE